jgi:hypothetical protein
MKTVAGVGGSDKPKNRFQKHVSEGREKGLKGKKALEYAFEKRRDK